MNLQDLTTAVLAAVPASQKDKVAADIALYGPTILTMAKADIESWISYVFVGKYADAYALYLKATSDSGILGEWQTEHAAWVTDNDANAAKIEMSNRIGLAFAQVMLGIMLTAVGL